MRINKYRFPKETNEEVLFIHDLDFEAILPDENGKLETTEMSAYNACWYCKKVLGMNIDENRIFDYDEELFKEIYPIFKKYINKFINYEITAGKVFYIKNLMKQYGGSGITLHCDRSGCVFEVTNIELKGNNSKFKYNHHL